MTRLPARAVLKALDGEWRLARLIDGQGGARLRGHARFERDPLGGLFYREAGWLSLGNQRPVRATRHYRYRAGDHDAVEILFADGPNAGGLFVRLSFEAAPQGARASAVHPCGPDLYRVSMTLMLPDRFETDITVSGPRKSYRAFSRYRRHGSAARHPSQAKTHRLEPPPSPDI